MLNHIDELKGAPYNPRKITDEASRCLRSSLDKFGDISGIVFNTRTGNLVAGHQRVAQLKELGAILERIGSAVYIKYRGQSFRVREVDWDHETEVQANITANNPHIAGVFTNSVEDLLDELAVDLPMEELTSIGLDKLMRQVRQESEQDTVPDSAGAVVKPGEVWQLGPHRIVCGDATNPEHVKAAMGELKPFIMVTDPPYGVEYSAEWRDGYEKSFGKPGESWRRGEVMNDDRSDWSDAYRLFTGDVVYVWHSDLHSADVWIGLTGQNFVIRAQLIWAKQKAVFGRGAYHWQHEPCWYAVRKGRKARWCGDRTQPTVWQIPNHNPMGGKADDANTNHSTQKPVECMARPMRNHGEAGDVVYDPFIGSGTSIVAAEQNDRVCCGLELNPNYCDVIVERWQNFTGGKAQRICEC